MSNRITAGRPAAVSSSLPGRIYKIFDGYYSNMTMMRTTVHGQFVDLSDGELVALSEDQELVELRQVTITVDAD